MRNIKYEQNKSGGKKICYFYKSWLQGQSAGSLPWTCWAQDVVTVVNMTVICWSRKTFQMSKLSVFLQGGMAATCYSMCCEKIAILICKCCQLLYKCDMLHDKHVEYKKKKRAVGETLMLQV